jgi:hypothetical protein
MHSDCCGEPAIRQTYSYLDGSIAVADVVENGATPEAERDVDAEAEPVVTEVPVHVDK